MDYSIIDRYYQFRGLKKPNATEALLFLISEVGELAEAHAMIAEFSPPAPFLERFALRMMVCMGRLADRVVSRKQGWTRNNGRKNDVLLPRYRKVADEIGDTLMMLYVYGGEESINPFHAMLNKMERKGYGRDTGSPQPDRGDV